MKNGTSPGEIKKDALQVLNTSDASQVKQEFDNRNSFFLKFDEV